MANSKNKLVWQALLTRLATITAGNGYSLTVANVRDRDRRAEDIDEYPEFQCVPIGEEHDGGAEKLICDDEYIYRYTVRQYLESNDDAPLLDATADLKSAVETHADGVYLGLGFIKSIKVESNDFWNITDEVRRDRVRLNVAIIAVRVRNTKGNPYGS